MPRAASAVLVRRARGWRVSVWNAVSARCERALNRNADYAAAVAADSRTGGVNFVDLF
jgi:hypothetical protein